MAVVQEPSPSLKRLATRVDASVGLLLKARGAAGLDTDWEALRHSWALTNLSARHSEAVTALAKTDVVLVPSAWAAARAGMETAAQALWLLSSNNVWEREARWLTLLEESAQTHDNAAVWFPTNHARYKRAATDIRAFVRGVADKLPEGTTVPRRVPRVSEMLQPYGEGLYPWYRLASQYVHSADMAVRHYRKNLGTDAQYGERVAEVDWVPPLQMAWNAFKASSVMLLAAAGDTISLPLEELDQRIHQAAEAVLSANTD